MSGRPGCTADSSPPAGGSRTPAPAASRNACAWAAPPCAPARRDRGRMQGSTCPPGPGDVRGHCAGGRLRAVPAPLRVPASSAPWLGLAASLRPSPASPAAPSLRSPPAGPPPSRADGRRTGAAAGVAPAAPARSRPPGAPVVVLDPGHNGGNAAHPREIQRRCPTGAAARSRATRPALDRRRLSRARLHLRRGPTGAESAGGGGRAGGADPGRRHRGRPVRRRARHGGPACGRRGRRLDPRRRGRCDGQRLPRRATPPRRSTTCSPVRRTSSARRCATA